ncbi:hypothetical protein EC991_007501 [Linnemannia zychae]|nr:hypothetical protein EC991_007501 [Linnemannia zychae]
MDLYDSSHITTSSRLTPAEEEELRGTSGNTEQIQDLHDDHIKTARVGSTESSPIAIVPPIQGSSDAAEADIKSKILVPILIVDNNKQQQQKDTSGRRLVDAGSRGMLQEEVRSRIQASASMTEDLEKASQSQNYTDHLGLCLVTFPQYEIALYPQ